MTSRDSGEDLLKKLDKPSAVIVAIVYLSLFVDNMLLTVVVPIIPDYLYKLQRKEATESDDSLFGGSDNATRVENDDILRPDNIMGENNLIGLLLASKAFAQLFANPFIGSAINRLDNILLVEARIAVVVTIGFLRIGYSSPLLIGLAILLASSLMFAVGESFVLLVVARSVQGVGSACISIAGMGLIADKYPDNEERSRIMGIALGGIAVGVLVGYPFGSVLYNFVGKTAPFSAIAFLIVVISILQIVFMRPTLRSETLLVGPSIFKLLLDPFIAVTVGAICVSTSAMAILEPCLPLWVLQVMAPPKWQLGTVFIPDSLGYLIGTHFFGPVAFSVGMWLTAMMSLLLVGACAMTVPFATSISHLLLPHFGIGLGIGITDASLMPLLASLVDKRHVAIYGSVYAIAQVAVSLAYSIGPLLGSQLVNTMGFPALMRCLGLINVIYSPLCWFLKDTCKEETKMTLITPNAVPDYKTIRAKCKDGSNQYTLFRDEN